MVPTRDGGCWRCGVSVMPLRYHAPADRGSGWWWPTLESAQQCGAKFRIASSIRATHQIVQVDIQVEDAFGDLRSLLFSEVPLACLPNAAAELSAAKPRDGGETQGMICSLSYVFLPGFASGSSGERVMSISCDLDAAPARLGALSLPRTQRRR